jgi:nucleoside-diphosphate-sugar epimerase
MRPEQAGRRVTAPGKGKEGTSIMSTTTTSEPLALVTGASGFVAGHCVAELLAHGHRVRGTVRNAQDEAKVGHLRRLGAAHDGRLELVEADLTADDGWARAVDGCAHVLHVASPFPSTLPRNEAELIVPAVEGTRRVLAACAGARGVRRVVLTSSLAAVVYGHGDTGDRVFTERDWSNPDRCAPYQKSKTLAERAAWDFVAQLPAPAPFDLVVINPGFVVGPLLGTVCGTSGELVRKLLRREMPACPELGWAMVDVRDIARAERLALETPSAGGQRFIVAGDHVWIRDAARMLAEEFAPLGFRVPTGALPYWALWMIARFDRTIRMSLDYVGHREIVSSAKSRDQLGLVLRPPRESLVDMAHSLIEQGIVAQPASRRAA